MSRWLALRAAVLAAVLVLAGCAPPGKTAEAADLTARWKAGDTVSYRMHQVLDASAASGTGTQGVKVDTTATETTRVVSVDPDGTATLRVTLGNVSGTANGRPLPAPATPPVVTVRVTRDGRLLPASGGAGVDAGLPGSGETWSLLPDHPVRPGDTWAADYERPNPVGSGTVSVHATSRYLRDEKVGGVSAAVVETRSTEPLDVVVDFDQVNALLGGQGQVPARLSGVKLHEKGTITSDSTDWIDKGSRQVVKASLRASLDLSFALLGLPASAAAGAPGEMRLSGPLTVTLDRV